MQIYENMCYGWMIRISTLLPNHALKKKMNNLTKKLKKLYEVTKKLQRVDATFFVACAYCDTVLQNYSTLSDCLDPDARIVVNLLLESVLLQV